MSPHSFTSDHLFLNRSKKNYRFPSASASENNYKNYRFGRRASTRAKKKKVFSDPVLTATAPVKSPAITPNGEGSQEENEMGVPFAS